MEHSPLTSEAARRARYAVRSTPVDVDDADGSSCLAYLNGALVELAVRATPGTPGSVTYLVPRTGAPGHDTVVRTGHVEVFMRPVGP